MYLVSVSLHHALSGASIPLIFLWQSVHQYEEQTQGFCLILICWNFPPLQPTVKSLSRSVWLTLSQTQTTGPQVKHFFLTIAITEFDVSSLCFIIIFAFSLASWSTIILCSSLLVSKFQPGSVISPEQARKFLL